MKKILYIQPIHPYDMDLLREKYNVVVAPDTNRETLMREIRDASAIVTRLSTVDADLMAAGRTLAVLGFGRIGQCVTRMAARGLDMHVRVYDPFAARDSVEGAGYTFCETAAEAMRGADAVSPHVPLTDATCALVNRENIALMNRGGYVLNFARGGVVDYDALEEAILSGHIAGAALDTFDTEPPRIDRPLFRQENVILSPHCGTFTEDSRRRMSLRLAEEIDRVLSE